MHPQEFTTKMIASGRAAELAEMVRKRASEHYELKCHEHEDVYNFTNRFMISVVGQLRLLKAGDSMDDDEFLSVWRSLGLWGLNRHDLAEYLEHNEI